MSSKPKPRPKPQKPKPSVNDGGYIWVGYKIILKNNIHMRHGSLFTGIGVFDLAAEQTGYTNIFGCDNDPYCKLHYQERYPGGIFYDDIKTIKKIPNIDVLTFGFPCQDASIAGPVKHINPLQQARTGLFYEAIRIISNADVQPQFVIAENVARLRNFGLIDCLRAFAACGYIPGYAIIPACQFGALHARQRLFIFANPIRFGRDPIIRVLQRVLTQNQGSHDLERQNNSEIFKAIMSETDGYPVGADHGTTDWLYHGLRAKAIGNSIYFPVAETIMREIKGEIERADN